jgi:pimeloyl-ACP methyl ester carboxylesterase
VIILRLPRRIHQARPGQPPSPAVAEPVDACPNPAGTPNRTQTAPFSHRRHGRLTDHRCRLEDSAHLDRPGRIKSPCLGMAFEHGCRFFPRVVREAAKRIPGCQYNQLPGLGHGAPLLAAGKVNPILAEFLDKQTHLNCRALARDPADISIGRRTRRPSPP